MHSLKDIIELYNSLSRIPLSVRKLVFMRVVEILWMYHPVMLTEAKPDVILLSSLKYISRPANSLFFSSFVTSA